jgi:hypothetical protein
LQWDPNSSSQQVEGYKVHYGTNKYQLNQVIDVGDTTSLNLDQLPLTEYEQYWFSVSAYNMAGESGKTSPLSYIPPGTSPVFTWTGAVNSDWGEPENWDVGEVPGDGDYVIISADRQSAIHSIINGQSIIDQLSCSGQLTISGGSISIDGDY